MTCHSGAFAEARSATADEPGIQGPNLRARGPWIPGPLALRLASRNDNYSTIAIARSAMRSRAESFSVTLLSWPQAARISRPRGVRTGEA